MFFLFGHLCLLCLSLFFSNNVSAQDCDNAYETNTHISLRPLGFSPDNNLLAIYYDKTIEFWDLQKNKIKTSFEYNGGVYGTNDWSPDSKRTLLSLNKNSKTEYVVFDVDKSTYWKLPLNEDSGLKGFIGSDSLWSFKDNKLSVLSFKPDGDNKVAAVKEEWAITVTDNVKGIYYMPGEKRFLVFIIDAKENLAGYTIRSGDADLTPMPKDVNKEIKKIYINYDNSADAILFKIPKADEGVLFNKHNFQMSEVGKYNMPALNSRIKFNLTHALSIYHSINQENAITKVKDSYSYRELVGPVNNSGFKVEDASNDLIVTNDLTKIACVYECRKDAYFVAIYDTKNNKSNPAKMILNKVSFPVMEQLAGFIETHKDTFELFVHNLLKKEWFDNGYELVPGIQPLTFGHAAEKFRIEPGYQYVAYRIGYDYIFPPLHDEIPTEEQPTILTMGAYAQDGYVWNSKSVFWSYLGVTLEQYFHTGTSVLAEVSFAIDGKSKMMKYIPKEAVRVYILRKKADSHPSESYNFDINKQERYVEETKPSTYTTSRSDCASKNNEADEFVVMRRLRDETGSIPDVEVVVSEVGSGVTTKPFHAPDYKGKVVVIGFTTSPCNELVLHNTTANTFEAAKTKFRTDESFYSAEFRKVLKDAGIYMAKIDIDNSANTGSKFQVTVRNASDHKTEGVSLIMVYHHK